MKLSGGCRESRCCWWLVDNAAELAAMSGDFIVILRYLCEVLSTTRSAEQAEPLVLEGILIMLHGAPPSVTRSTEFHDIVWSVQTLSRHRYCIVRREYCITTATNSTPA